MNPRVAIAVLIIAVVVILALVLRPATPSNALVSKPPELVTNKAALVAAKKASEASTKQANAVQASATKVAAAAQPILEGYSFLSQNSELIMSYAVNFDPKLNSSSTDKFAAALAKNWKIKELENYAPKKVTIEFYGGKARIKATRSFDPKGKAL